jgi:type IX secretion system PorP/SprF family membrane protein
MKKSFTLTSTLLLFLAFSLKAQQVPLYNLYYTNPIIYNPAAAGLQGGINAFVSHKKQWSGITGAPVINTVTFDTPFYADKASVGIKAVDETFGITKRTEGLLTLGYNLQIAEKTFARFGVSGGYSNTNLNFNNAVINDPNDPLLQEGFYSRNNVDVSAGIMLVHGNLQLGVAVPQALPSAISESNDDRIAQQFIRHYTGSVLYKIDLGKDKKVAIVPLVITRYAPSIPLQYDVNIITDWNRIGWIGASFKNNYAVGVFGGIRIAEKLSLAYAYDMPFNALSRQAGISHEIALGYTMRGNDKKKPVRGKSKDADEILRMIDDFYDKKTKNKQAVKDHAIEIKSEIEKYNKINKKNKKKNKK